jgi:hypothetical protein
VIFNFQYQKTANTPYGVFCIIRTRSPAAIFKSVGKMAKMVPKMAPALFAHKHT